MAPADRPEPTGWDLQGQLDRLREDLKAALDRAEDHVTSQGLHMLLGRVDDQIKALAEDVAQERGMRAVDIEGLRRQLDTELGRLEKRADKAEERAKDESRERRADRRVVYGAAIAGGISLLLWVLDKWSGGIGP